MIQIDHKSHTSSMTLCTFAKRDFKNWRGLPSSCSLADVIRHFRRLNDGCGQARLGQRKSSFVMVMAEEYCNPIRLWLCGRQVLALDVAVPELTPQLPSLQAVLGEPTTKLDCYLGYLRYEQAEWVYPERGLAIFVNPESQRLERIVVFRSTTIDIYKAQFRVHLRMRRLPSSRRWH